MSLRLQKIPNALIKIWVITSGLRYPAVIYVVIHISALFTFTLKAEASMSSKMSAATYKTTVKILNVINS